MLARLGPLEIEVRQRQQRTIHKLNKSADKGVIKTVPFWKDKLLGKMIEAAFGRANRRRARRDDDQRSKGFHFFFFSLSISP